MEKEKAKSRHSRVAMIVVETALGVAVLHCDLEGGDKGYVFDDDGDGGDSEY
jgi:hypothetical protein